MGEISLTPLIMGVIFLLLGIALVFVGRAEEKGFYKSASSRYDAREYLERSPEHPALKALKIGGWILIAVSLVMLAIGFSTLPW
ncbi:MAG: hypothetical protein V1849_03470 [Chloroflexota bacterium]